MMQGKVNQSCEATLSVAVRNVDILKSVDAVIDTGFSGFLTLPSSIIAKLDLNLVGVHSPPLCGGILKPCAVGFYPTSKSVSIPRPLAAGLFIGTPISEVE
jgi:hypothetical protein